MVAHLLQGTVIWHGEFKKHQGYFYMHDATGLENACIIVGVIIKKEMQVNFAEI